MTEKQPAIPLKPGENYRFHFDATRCIGCKCCEVACHEQNNNPAEVKWRQVGEIEGGLFPDTKRVHISMACNHCLDPACLKGCPVDAYYKDEKTGVVLMREDACIGCQYCTWNCPYGAPQFNPDRGMVTKCDMCHNRIDEGRKPACVEACPSEALTIEVFNVEDWKKDLATGVAPANAPGVPDASITQSTTRITFDADGEKLARIDQYRLHPEHPHYSLILLTVLTQLSVGGFSCLLILEGLHHFLNLPDFFARFLRAGHWTMLAVAILALNTSVFHLGRPIHAMRALKMWKRSWLSREVLFFTLFAGGATLYSLLDLVKLLPITLPAIPGEARAILGIFVTLFGLAGVYCSAMIYRVPARPSWNTRRTTVAFMSTAFILGPLLALVVFVWDVHAQSISWLEVAPTIRTVGLFLTSILMIAGFMQVGGIFVKVLNIMNHEQPELRASSYLLLQRFKGLFFSRVGILFLALLLAPLSLFMFVSGSTIHLNQLGLWLSILMVLATLSEFAGRYLFFVTVVPKKRPEGYF